MIKGIIFDFNGTLFIDHRFHDVSWERTINELTGGRLDFESFFPSIKNKHNYLAVRRIKTMYPDLANESEDYWSRRKEEMYRLACEEENYNKLTPGAYKLLDYLKNNNIPLGLCTSSIIENVNWFYSYLGIGEWFTMDKTVYDNYTYTSKTEMYLDCAKKIGVDVKDILVFEDSPNSIKECLASGVQALIALKRDDCPPLEKDPRILQVINDFTELDYSLIDIGK